MDVPVARTLLARAFAEDPMFKWIFPQQSTRLESTAAWLGTFVERYAAIDRMVGFEEGAVVLWRLPGDPREQPATLPTAGGLLTALVGDRRTQAIGEALSVIAELTPSDPHVYVNLLGVDPSRQGAGLGWQVLEPILTAARAERLGVHLETTNPRNEAFYARAGFVVTGQARLGTDGPTMRAMFLACG